MIELEEVAGLVPPQKRLRLREETFEPPPTLLPQLDQYPRGTQNMVELDRALEFVHDYYSGPEIELPD